MSTHRTAQPVCQHAADLEMSPADRSVALHIQASLGGNVNTLVAEARPRLLRLARLHGIAVDLVEDVVQETCLEAWRHLDQLREPARFASWLDGICRNVCRRQASALSRHAHETHLGSAEDEADWVSVNPHNPPAFDPSAELERQDRQILLDRALSHLSASARELVELCYLAELPQREVAERLDMSLGALELKLHRARRHLRQVLSGALRADAEALGLVVNQDEAMGWQETRQWCWLCGKRRLRGAFEQRPAGVVALRLRCPDCSARYGVDLTGSGDVISVAGLRAFRPAMKRAFRAACEYAVNSVHHRVCGSCQSRVQVRLVSRHAPGDAFVPVRSPLCPQRSFLIVECPRCGIYDTDLVMGLLLEPAARAFVLERPRVLFEPDTLASYAGQDAIRSRLVDLRTAEQMTIMAHPETLEIMATLLQ